MKQLRGTKLKSSDKQYVLSAYVNRYTGEHVPRWASMQDNCPVQFESDKDWLENTLFYVTKHGNLDKRYSRCESSPTKFVNGVRETV